MPWNSCIYSLLSSFYNIMSSQGKPHPSCTLSGAQRKRQKKVKVGRKQYKKNTKKNTKNGKLEQEVKYKYKICSVTHSTDMDNETVVMLLVWCQYTVNRTFSLSIFAVNWHGDFSKGSFDLWPQDTWMKMGSMGTHKSSPLQACPPTHTGQTHRHCDNCHSVFKYTLTAPQLHHRYWNLKFVFLSLW